MAVRKPEDMNGAFADAYNSGDVERLLALYEPGAVLAPQPSERAVGADEIRAAFVELLALQGEMTSKNNYCLQVGDLALLQGEWRLSFVGPSDVRIELSSRSAEVVRRQADGSWLYVIDHPFGDDDPD
jgi:ketosteroid isomerase-like protein